MSRLPNIPCAGGCGKLMYSGRGSLPAGIATCRQCRAKTAPLRIKRVLREIVCSECPVKITTTDRRRMTCSPTCKAERKRRMERLKPYSDRHRAKDQKRRARKRGVDAVTVINSEIFERDRWKCGICKRRVDRDLVWPAPMSPSLDHIVPLSEGGPHRPENVRLAHLHCNVSRGNRGGGEQLQLMVWTSPAPRQRRGYCGCGEKKVRSRCRTCNPVVKRERKVPVVTVIPDRPCLECGVTLVFDGKRGRPRKWCTTCRPPAEKRMTRTEAAA
jgi:hypothetical protein